MIEALRLSVPKIGEELLIIGEGEWVRKLYHQLVPEKQNGSEAEGLGIRVDGQTLRQLTASNGISRIVIAEPTSQNLDGLTSTLLECKLRGVQVESCVDFYERVHRKLWLEALRPEWLVFADGFRISKSYLRLKRLLDIVSALALLLLTAPLLVLVAIAIKLTSPGPVLFGQERVGQGGKRFVLYKFRSMRQDAEGETGPVWTSNSDGRVTALGRWLRKFHVDEIPQVYNVLRGDLSFVGPRPERLHFVDLLGQRIPYYNLRHLVKPGITGWAQINYGYAASIEDAYEKLQYDLYYCKNASLILDLVIGLRTLKVVLSGRGR